MYFLHVKCSVGDIWVLKLFKGTLLVGSDLSSDLSQPKASGFNHAGMRLRINHLSPESI